MFQGVDLRHYSKEVESELLQVENASLQDCILFIENTMFVFIDISLNKNGALMLLESAYLIVILMSLNFIKPMLLCQLIRP